MSEDRVAPVCRAPRFACPILLLAWAWLAGPPDVLAAHALRAGGGQETGGAAAVEALRRQCEDLDAEVGRLARIRDEFSLLEGLGDRLRREIRTDSGGSLFAHVMDLEDQVRMRRERDPRADSDPAFRALVQGYNEANAQYRESVTNYVRQDLEMEFHRIGSYDALVSRYGAAVKAWQESRGRLVEAEPERDRACEAFERTVADLEELWASGALGGGDVIARVRGATPPDATVGRLVFGQVRRVPLKAGDVLRTGETIATGSGSVHVEIAGDPHIAILGPRSEGAVVELATPMPGAPATMLNLVRGALRVLRETGLVVDPFPENAPTVRAGSTICGIRGTDVLVTYAPESASVEVVVSDGRVDVGLGGRRQALEAGQTVAVRGGSLGPASTMAPGEWVQRLATAGVPPNAPQPAETLAFDWDCDARGQTCVVVRYQGKGYKAEHHVVRNAMNTLVDVYYFPTMIDGRPVLDGAGQQIWGRFARVPAASAPGSGPARFFLVTGSWENGALRETETEMSPFELVAAGATSRAFVVGEQQALPPASAAGEPLYMIRRWCSGIPAEFSRSFQGKAVFVDGDYGLLTIGQLKQLNLSPIAVNTSGPYPSVAYVSQMVGAWRQRPEGFPCVQPLNLAPVEVNRPELPPSMRSSDPLGQGR